MRHDFSERSEGRHIILRCSCGWQHREAREQNPKARTQKLKAAVVRHLKQVVAENRRPSA